MSEGNIEALRAAISAAQQEIEGVQSALETVRTRCEGATAIIARVTEGSNNEQAAAAMARLSIIATDCDDMIGNAMMSIEQLEAYLATR